MLQVALVYNLNRGKNDYEAEFDAPITIESLIKALQICHEVKAIEATRDLAAWVLKLQEYTPDIVFNVAEGFSGPAREAFYPALFEQLGIKYSGPDSTNLLVCHNKYLCKRILQRNSVRVPAGQVITAPEDPSDFKRIKFPVIVKLNSEGSSLGTSPASIVSDKQQLLKQIKKLWDRYHRNILIEQYVPGMDVSIAFIEGIGVLNPAQVLYDNGDNIYDWELKTVHDKMVNIDEAKGLLPPKVQEIKIISEKIVRALDIKGYAKLDFKLSETGEIYLLEVNGQVSFHPEGEFMVSAKASGLSFAEVVLHIVEYSLKSNFKNSVGGFNDFIYE